MTDLDTSLEERVRDIAGALAGRRGALLPILHAVQEELGWIDPAAVAVVADVLNLSRAEVHGVVTFYDDFRTEPPPAASVRLCRAEACQARGGEALATEVAASLPEGVEVGEVFCLGLCGTGPAAMVDGTLVAPASPPAITAVLERRAPDPPPVTEPAAEPATGVVYVPCDSVAVARGADAIAAAHAAAGATVVRTGSRGMLWREPLVEVAGPDGHRPVGDDPWLTGQTRCTMARVGVVDPRSADDYLAHGGTVGLRRALDLPPDAVVAAVEASGLRGRGGAGFPTGTKWRTVLDTASDETFVVANADEGDSGTFADRMLMEGDPFSLLEGMAIAAHATGATAGFVYVRSEYPLAVAAMTTAIEIAYARGWLGEGILGSDLRFDVEVRVGAGSYVCGEETAMLESIEGRRGEVRAKPPVPAVAGLFGRPTVVNNVVTLATVPWILAHGAEAYADMGTGRSRGTGVFQLAGNVAHPGIVEVPFGVTLGELLERWGGGTASGRPIRAVQVGGPLGAYLPPSRFDLPLDYEAFAAADALLGHGGIVVFDDTVDLAAQARFAMHFCAVESCGKCTPCRIGSVRGVELLDEVIAGRDVERNLALLDELCEVMADASLCAMGGLTPVPVRSARRHFPEDFRRAAQP